MFTALSTRTAALGLAVLALAGCEGMGMGTGAGPVVGNSNAVGTPITTGGVVECERPDEPTGQLVETPGGGTTAVIDTGAGAVPPIAC